MKVKDSDILRRARQMIENGETHRLCYAIGYAASELDVYFRGGYLTRWVGKMLGRHAFFEDWVIEHHPEFAKKKKITSFDHMDKLRPGRLAWLDWMIAECEREGA